MHFLGGRISLSKNGLETRFSERMSQSAHTAIERWWELVFSAYFMVSCQTPLFQSFGADPQPLTATPAVHHPWWDVAGGWKATLNNLRLLIQPFVALCLLLPWLTVFYIPALARSLQQLICCINYWP